MPEFTINVEFEVFCAKCSAGLCNESATGQTFRRAQNYVQVGPCETCLDAAREEGHADGFDEGYERAKEEYCET